MTYTWDEDFEAYPSGGLTGNTMGEALRRIRAAFFERIDVEHSINEGLLSSSAGAHVLPFQVVEFLEDGETSASHGVDGALQFVDGVLYRDDGSSMTALIEADHGALTNLDAADAHSIYLPVTGSFIQNEFTLPAIVGLPTTYGTPTDDDALSRGQHLVEDVSGGANHDDDLLGQSDLPTSIPLTKLNVTSRTIDISIGNTEATLRDTNGLSSFPVGGTGSSGGGNIYFKCTTVDNDDYYGSVVLYIESISAVIQRLLYMTLED